MNGTGSSRDVSLRGSSGSQEVGAAGGRLK